MIGSLEETCVAFCQRVQGLQDLPFPSSWSKQARAAAVRHSRTWVLQAVLRWSCFSVGPEGLDVAAHLCPRHGSYVFPEWQKPIRHCPWQNVTQT